MSDKPEAPIAVTQGDPAGIGPEVVVKAIAAMPEEADNLVVVGDPRVMRDACDRWAPGLKLMVVDVPIKGEWSDPAARGHQMVAIIRTAVEGCRAGSYAAMATAPIDKSTLKAAGYDRWEGHTEMLREFCEVDDVVMMLAGPGLRVALATIHMALREVPGALTVEGIRRVIEITDADLKAKFGLNRPKIAVCGLNPHAGEGGLFGDEETRVIIPAIEAAQNEKIEVSGPYPGDTVFYQAAKQGKYDAVVAMYHDQGLGPLKTLHMDEGINVTLGLPIARVSVDHGTAPDIAGKGIADEKSMIAAIRTCREMRRSRS